MCIFVTRPFYWYQTVLPRNLYLDFLTYFWQKLNLGLNFSTKRDWAFILRILVCIPCGMTFLFSGFLVFCLNPKFWPRDLDHDFWPTFENINLDHNFGNKRDRTVTCSAFNKKENKFLCRLRSIAAHLDNFVRGLSVRLSICLSLCLSGSHTLLVVTHSYVSQANMHSSECCHYFLYIYCFNTVLSDKHVYYVCFLAAHAMYAVSVCLLLTLL